MDCLMWVGGGSVFLLLFMCEMGHVYMFAQVHYVFVFVCVCVGGSQVCACVYPWVHLCLRTCVGVLCAPDFGLPWAESSYFRAFTL